MTSEFKLIVFTTNCPLKRFPQNTVQNYSNKTQAQTVAKAKLQKNKNLYTKTVVKAKLYINLLVHCEGQ